MTKAGFKTIGLTALLTLSLIHQAVAGSWIKAETTHFIIYSDNDEKSTRDYASRLEAFNTIATNFYRRLSDSEVSDTTKPVFYFFDDLSIFKAVRPKLTNGFIISLSCRDGAANFWSNNKDINSDATQEYQFQSLNTLVASRYSSGMPDWLSRGLNLYLLTADIKNDTVQLGAASPYQFSYQTDYVSDHRQSLMAKNDRIPYAEILSGKPSNLKKTGSIPGQSWIITHYMLTDPQNQAKLFTYIDLYNHGATSLEAWKKAVGLDPSFFDDLTVNYMAKGVPIVTYKFLPLAGDAVAITKLAAYNDSVPMLSAALNTCPDKNYQSEIEARLEKVAAVMPDDTFVQREAARAQVWYSDKPETALPYLQKQITENPKDYDAHYMLGRLLLRQAQYAKARVELGTAYQRDKVNEIARYLADPKLPPLDHGGYQGQLWHYIAHAVARAFLASGHTR